MVDDITTRDVTINSLFNNTNTILEEKVKRK